MTQTVVEGKSLGELDLKRTSVFIVFGAAYLGGFQWWIQVSISLSRSVYLSVCRSVGRSVLSDFVCVCVCMPAGLFVFASLSLSLFVRVHKYLGTYRCVHSAAGRASLLIHFEHVHVRILV
jgi:hypothetical protein